MEPGVTQAATQETMWSAIEADEKLSMLVDLIIAADLVGTLNGTGEALFEGTIFAPVNEAFEGEGEADAKALKLPANKDYLVQAWPDHDVMPLQMLPSAVEVHGDLQSLSS